MPRPVVSVIAVPSGDELQEFADELKLLAPITQLPNCKSLEHARQVISALSAVDLRYRTHAVSNIHILKVLGWKHRWNSRGGRGERLGIQVALQELGFKTSRFQPQVGPDGIQEPRDNFYGPHVWFW